MSYDLILVRRSVAVVRRITLNRPEKRNALSNALRGEIFDCLHKNDVDPDVR